MLDFREMPNTDFTWEKKLLQLGTSTINQMSQGHATEACPYLEGNLEEAFLLSSSNQQILIIITEVSHALVVQMSHSAIWVEGVQHRLPTQCRCCSASQPDLVWQT